MAKAGFDLAGFTVRDRQGLVIGRVECPIYGKAPSEPVALAVKTGLLSRRMVETNTIELIDRVNRIIRLGVDRSSVPTLL